MQNGVKKINSLCDVSNNLKIRSSVIEHIIKAEKEYEKTLDFLANVSARRTNKVYTGT